MTRPSHQFQTPHTQQQQQQQQEKLPIFQRSAFPRAEDLAIACARAPSVHIARAPTLYQPRPLAIWEGIPTEPNDTQQERNADRPPPSTERTADELVSEVGD